MHGSSVTTNRVTTPKLKRTFDIVLAIPALLIAAPIVAVAAIVIKLGSPGPILYRGWRAGLGGRPFRIYKLRTMEAGADTTGPEITRANDERVTRIGRVLRRTKVDELPQLLNVLKGDMSLVGPRPEHPNYVRLYTPEQRRVLEVKPGMTSLASILYADEQDMLVGDSAEKTYVDKVMPGKLEIDRRYVEQQSLAEDFLVLLRTVGLVAKRSIPMDEHEPPPAPRSGVARAATLLLAFTVACLPLYVVRFRYGPISTTLLELLVLATIATYLVARWREHSLRLNRTPYDAPILLLLLAGAIAVFVPPDRWHALGLYRAYFVEPIAIFYVAVDLLRRPHETRTVLLGLGIGSSIFAVMNIVAFVVAYAEGTIVLGSPPTALYTSSPEVAMFLEPPLALAAGFVLFADNRKDRVLALAWMGCLVPELVLTLSRGAYFAIAVLVLVAIISNRRRLWLAAGVAAAATVAVLLILQIPLVARRFAGQFNLFDSKTTIRGRLSIFTDTLAMLRDHPILGMGLGGYHYLFRGKIPEIYPHDVWLTFWVEVGLLGLIAFAAIYFGLLYRGWRALPRVNGFYRPLLWGVLGGFVLWGVHGLVDSPYWKNDMSLEFWIIAAFEVVAIRNIASARRHSESKRVAFERRVPDRN